MTAPLGWTEVRVTCPLGWQELVADVLAAITSGSVAIATPAEAGGSALARVTAHLAASDDSPDLRERVRARLAALADATGADELRNVSVELAPLAPEDYATSWRASWKPFRIGRLCIVPPWRATPLRASDLALVLEPGGAFGSGRHATTRACLRELQERIRGGERVLDAGSGSGILAVAACRLGARAALGFDVDRHARPYAEALAAANGVADRCRFRTGGFELLASEPGRFDVVLANLYADVLVARAGTLARALAPEGWLACSGCAREHLAATLAALEAAGLAVHEVRGSGRWRTIRGGHRERLRTARASPREC